MKCPAQEQRGGRREAYRAVRRRRASPWWWHAERYTKNELFQAFEQARFRDLVFRLCPWRYFRLNGGW